MEKSPTETKKPVSDKQKFIVIGVLAALVLGIGAFQFMGGEAPKKPSAKKSSDTVKDAKGEPLDESKAALTKLIATNLPARDPFRPADIPGMPEPQKSPDTTKAPDPEPPKVEPSKTPTREVAGTTGSPGILKGSIPVDPMGGLPPAGGGGPKVMVQPGAPLRAPGEPPYSVAGVIIGKEKMVVLQTDSGSQVLVKLGDKIDGDNRVVSIEAGGKVRVKSGKKTSTLPSIPSEVPKPGGPTMAP